MSRKKAAPSPALKIKATPNNLSDKEHLVDIVRAGTGSTKKAAIETVNAIIDTVTVSLRRNKRFQIVGFGTFDVVKRKARMGRNPMTGAKIRIKAARRVRFKAGAELKDSV